MASDRKTARRAGVSVWVILLFVPSLVAVGLLLPQFGEQEQGLLPEILGSHVAYTESFYAFAVEAKKWGGVLFGLSCLIGIAFWSLGIRGWRKRLRLFRATAVANYKTFTFGHTFFAAAVAAVLAALLVFASPELRAMPMVNWIILVAGCGFLAALQHFVTLLGITNTRRLFRGK